MNTPSLMGALALSTAIVAPAAAAPVYFTDEAPFLAAVGSGLAVDRFNDNFNVGGFSATVVRPGFSLTETGEVPTIYSTIAFNFYNLPTYEGAGAAAYSDNGDSVATFVFDEAINAFGVQIVTSADATFTVGGDLSATGSTVQYAYRFFGVYDATGTFDAVTFDVAGADLGVSFDAVRFGTAGIPEPATWGMMILGAAGTGGALRRRRTGARVRYA